MDVQTLLDRAEIHDVLVRYAEAIDQRDFDALRSCFTPDVVPEYVGIDLEPGADAVVEYIRTGIEDFASSVHLVGNVVVEDGDGTIVSQSRAIAYLVRPGADGELRMFVRGVRYDDEWVRADGRLLISRRRHQAEWSVEAPVELFASSWGGPVA